MSQTKPYVFEGSYDLPASTGRVFEALTDPAQLEVWFAEHAEVEAQIGGAYRFWGKHTAYVRSQEDADQRINAFEAGEVLGFDWNWGGAPTSAHLRLSMAEGGTVVSIRHESGGIVKGHLARDMVYLLDDFWSLSMGNLRSYLETGQAALLPDHAQEGDDVVLSIEIDAPASVVWKSLTEPAQMNAWIAKDARVELRVGGAYSYGWDHGDETGNEDGCANVGPSKIVELEEGRLLAHDWTYEGDHTSRTEWRVEDLGMDRSRVTVRQVGVRSEKERGGYTNGWAKFLLALRDHSTGVGA